MSPSSLHITWGMLYCMYSYFPTTTIIKKEFIMCVSLKGFFLGKVTHIKNSGWKMLLTFLDVKFLFTKKMLNLLWNRFFQLILMQTWFHTNCQLLYKLINFASFAPLPHGFDDIFTSQCRNFGILLKWFSDKNSMKPTFYNFELCCQLTSQNIFQTRVNICFSTPCACYVLNHRRCKLLIQDRAICCISLSQNVSENSC